MLAERAEHGARLVEVARTGGARPGLCVLVGVDGTPGSRHVAEAAWRLLGPRAGRLVLTSVVSQDSADSDPAPPRAAAVGGPGEGELERAHRMLLEYAREVAPSEPTVEVVAGAPADALLTLAADEGADVIVVGPPHHRHGVFGVCRSLLARSPVPVLVAGARTPDAAPAPGG